jgi:hypothetical protein
MGGAYVAAHVHTRTGSFVMAVIAAVLVVMVIALFLEALLVRRLYGRDHLSQVLATFGVILVADDAVKMIWGPSPIMAPTPAFLAGPVQLLPDLPYPSYRIVILVAGVLVALALYLLVNHTRLGMLVRAGASNRPMAELMGVRVGRVFSLLFVLGAALAALAGWRADGPADGGADRHGRRDPDPFAGGAGDRRHRLDTRCVCRGHAGRPGRHAGPRFCAHGFTSLPVADAGVRPRAGDCRCGGLRLDGSRPRFQTSGPVPGSRLELCIP